MKKLYLASQSLARQQLLSDAKIPFTLIAQSADESLEEVHVASLQKTLEMLAVRKMEHVLMPKGAHEGDVAFVLTADTMGKDGDGAVHGKPASRNEAIAMIKALRGNGEVGTAFCLDRKVWRQGTWYTESRILRYVGASYTYSIPDEWIDEYLEHEPEYRDISGAITIEGYGSQFLQSCEGSYTAIVGLPLFEVREALEELGFYE